MELRITIKLDNAAFDDHLIDLEVADVLSSVDIRYLIDMDDFQQLYDSNGNRVGQAVLVGEG